MSIATLLQDDKARWKNLYVNSVNYNDGTSQNTASNGSSSGVFADSVFRITNNVDVSKFLQTSVGGSTGTSTTVACNQTTNRVLSLPDITDVLVATNTMDTLTNKTLTGASNTITARLLKSATTEVSVSAATAPTSGQVLTATSSTTATWQTPATKGMLHCVSNAVQSISLAAINVSNILINSWGSRTYMSSNTFSNNSGGDLDVYLYGMVRLGANYTGTVTIWFSISSSSSQPGQAINYYNNCLACMSTSSVVRLPPSSTVQFSFYVDTGPVNISIEASNGRSIFIVREL